MQMKLEDPGALTGATGADMKAASFTKAEYPSLSDRAISFTQIGTAALRVVHLAARHGLTIERAAMVAPLIYGEGRA